MKTPWLAILLISPLCAQETVLDLTALDNYAAQNVPAYITKDNTPNDNPITDMGATLGRVLFYDKRLSVDGTISCSSCHQQENAFGDIDQASRGVDGTTGRHSMRLINARFGDEDSFFWDERAPSLEFQTTQPIQDHVEMGFSGADGDPDFSDLVTRLQAIEAYHVLFTSVYGDSAITEDRVQKAMAQFIRSIQSFDSKYDEGRAQAQGDGSTFVNFTAEENAGKALFTSPPNAGGVGCAGCHRPPEFDIDPGTGHNGVTTALSGGQDLTNTRSPSLRDLVDSDGNPHGGFMHDASLSTLLAVIDHYDSIPAVTAGLDRRLSPGGNPLNLNLSTAEKASLVAFLETLTGQNVYTDVKWSSPFGDAGELSLIVLPQNSITLSSEQVEGVDYVVVSSQGVPQIDYIVQSSTDLETWGSGTTVTADADGVISYSQEMSDQRCFFRIGYVPEPILPVVE